MSVHKGDFLIIQHISNIPYILTYHVTFWDLNFNLIYKEVVPNKDVVVVYVEA